jgi:large subunit ribosomal protein L30
MILVLRIAGQAGNKIEIDEALVRLNIHRKLACTLVENNSVNMGMIQKVKDHIAYNEVSDDLIKQIITSRGQTLDGKPVAEKDVPKILEDIKKGNWKIKKFFRMHPPRGGFKKSTKIDASKGILGKNENLDKLILRML